MILKTRIPMPLMVIAPIAAGLLLAFCTPATGDTARQSTLPVTVAIDPFDPGRPVPPQFLGLSFEAAALGQLAQYADRGDLVRPAALARTRGAALRRYHRG